MNNKAIGIFDSGIGGLTVLKEMKKQMPNEEYIYIGDTENFPYGEKSREEIIQYTRNNIMKLIEQNVKMIVIACGTATSQALEIVRNEFDLPIIGIIEPTANYVSKLNLDKVGVIATTGTIRSKAWEKELEAKNPNLRVINKACPLLASIAESGKAKSKESKDAIHEYMQIFKDNDINTIILGCTHYPIYDEIIRNEFEYNVELVNTGVSVAYEIKRYLKENQLETNIKEEKEPKIIITKEITGYDKKAEEILKYDCQNS